MVWRIYYMFNPPALRSGKSRLLERLQYGTLYAYVLMCSYTPSMRVSDCTISPEQRVCEVIVIETMCLHAHSHSLSPVRATTLARSPSTSSIRGRYTAGHTGNRACSP